jgi:hypothetical protein
MGALGRRLPGVEARVVALQERRQAAQVAADVGVAVGEVQQLYRGLWVALCHLQVRLGRRLTAAERQRAIAEYLGVSEQELGPLADRRRARRAAEVQEPAAAAEGER